MGIVKVYDAMGCDLSMATELKKKSFGALFDMARAQAAANGLTEDAVEDEIAACRRERKARRKPSKKRRSSVQIIGA